ncbi:transposon Ty3-I Gag-Pol polyprotein [Trichonephila clavipes]|nr:transposon Ty3-I Gag-Pol polyprotein [Trichonephila clavipes]
MPQNLLEHVSASYLLLRLVGYQSSWRSTEDFQYTRPHLLGRSLSLVFLAPTAWRLTGSAIWRRGSVTTYWGSASRVTWRKTARRVWSAYFSSVPTSSKFRRRFRELSKTAFLSAVAHYMSRTSAVETNSHDVILGWDFLEASQAVIDCGQNELVLEDICRDSTAPDAWNLYATRDYTLNPHSLTRITVSGYQTRGDIM